VSSDNDHSLLFFSLPALKFLKQFFQNSHLSILTNVTIPNSFRIAFLPENTSSVKFYPTPQGFLCSENNSYLPANDRRVILKLID
ncbi:MAG: hypothetical protein ACRC37_07660, partial [Lentisphaeria bacterium]